jgi:hypothetical protein
MSINRAGGRHPFVRNPKAARRRCRLQSPSDSTSLISIVPLTTTPVTAASFQWACVAGSIESSLLAPPPSAEGTLPAHVCGGPTAARHGGQEPGALLLPLLQLDWATLCSDGGDGGGGSSRNARVDCGAVRKALGTVRVCVCVRVHCSAVHCECPLFCICGSVTHTNNTLRLHWPNRCGYCKGGAETKRAATKRTSVSFGLSARRLLCQDYQALIDLGWRRSGAWTCNYAWVYAAALPP